MDFVFGNLPNGIDKKDIKQLTQRFNPSNIQFMKNKYSEHSYYECVVLHYPKSLDCFFKFLI